MPVRHRFNVGDVFCVHDQDDWLDEDERAKPFLVFYLTGEIQEPRIGKSRTEKIFTYQVLTMTDAWEKEGWSIQSPINVFRGLTSRWLSALCSEPCRVRGWRNTWCLHAPVAS